jgi:hypothetical protein
MGVIPAARRVLLVKTVRATLAAIPIYRESRSTPFMVQCIAVNIMFLLTILKKYAGSIILRQADMFYPKKLCCLLHVEVL